MPESTPIQIEDVKRLDVRPGDQLVFTVAATMPADAVHQVVEQLRATFGDEVAVLVVTSNITITVVRTEAVLERIADRAAGLLSERATNNALRSYGGFRA